MFYYGYSKASILSDVWLPCRNNIITDTHKKIYLFAGKYNYYVNIYASNLNGWTTFLYSYSLINPLSQHQHQHHSPFSFFE